MWFKKNNTAHLVELHLHKNVAHGVQKPALCGALGCTSVWLFRNL